MNKWQCIIKYTLYIVCNILLSTIWVICITKYSNMHKAVFYFSTHYYEIREANDLGYDEHWWCISINYNIFYKINKGLEVNAKLLLSNGILTQSING